MILNIIHSLYRQRLANDKGSNRHIQLSKIFLGQAIREYNQQNHTLIAPASDELIIVIDGNNVHLTNREMRHNNNDQDFELLIIEALK